MSFASIQPHRSIANSRSRTTPSHKRTLSSTCLTTLTGDQVTVGNASLAKDFSRLRRVKICLILRCSKTAWL